METMTSLHTPELLFHAAPLHYMPRIVQDGALYSAGVLAAYGVAPRATAQRRDRMLSLTDFVHLSPRSQTPLLADKLGRGYPHVLLVFHAEDVFAMPEVALLPYNTKSWRTRAAFQPITEPAEREALWRRHTSTGRFPSLEVLIKYGLSLEHLERIALFTALEHRQLTKTLNALALPVPAPLTTDSTLFPRCPNYAPTTDKAISDYFDACRAAKAVLPPPLIPFD
jgi:hypothetical protein